ncbi:MAG: hypothetical protein JWR19_1908 [Pedosphaera sp.]|nr:hypothetical protein [Pedosphaera sp.]
MPKLESPDRRFARVAVFLLLLTLSCLPTLRARDAFVVLSGGDSPFGNNYSQYLQAKALATYFEANYPPNSVWVFFGAGNIEGQKPIFGDVRHQTKQNGIIVDAWLPGSLPHNLPARRDIILRAFSEQILPTVADGGTVYLFVGDHGSRSRGRPAESLIDLWSMERDTTSDHGWRSNEDESLGVAELRRTLFKGIGKGHVVFCMTQCHSGGFHYLAIPHELSPNPKWFTTVPAWAAFKNQPSFPLAAGFTATDEMSLASGCDPDPDPANWAGYERYIPESLLGQNLLTHESTGHGLRSFADAHAAAMLSDHTIDKPYSTSEQYLERWANLIETRLFKESNLAPMVKKSVANYKRTVGGTAPKLSDPAFQERQTQFGRFLNNLSQSDPALKDLLFTGTRQDLQSAIDPPQPTQPPPGRRRGGGGSSAESRKLWAETVRPAWKKAITANQITNISAAALEFEKYLLTQEDKGRNYLSGGGAALQEEVFWRSGYSDPQTVNLAKAEAVAQWGANRRAKILDWAKTANDPTVRTAAERIAQIRARRRANPAPDNSPAIFPPPIDTQTAAERALFYRRVLAAWEFLLALDERPALARIKELTDLERTPLPSPKS